MLVVHILAKTHNNKMIEVTKVIANSRYTSAYFKMRWSYFYYKETNEWIKILKIPIDKRLRKQPRPVYYEDDNKDYKGKAKRPEYIKELLFRIELWWKYKSSNVYVR